MVLFELIYDILTVLKAILNIRRDYKYWGVLMFHYKISDYV